MVSSVGDIFSHYLHTSLQMRDIFVHVYYVHDSTWIGDRLQAAKPSRYVTSH